MVDILSDFVGETIIRWIDIEKEYKMNVTLCRDIFDAKLALAICCRSSWPRWVSHSEDCYLRKPKWNDKYEGKRVVMMDGTNVNLQFKASSVDAQCTTYSAYYGGNVCKGSVFLQLCGWLGVEHL